MCLYSIKYSRYEQEYHIPMNKIIERKPNGRVRTICALHLKVLRPWRAHALSKECSHAIYLTHSSNRLP